jgi:hypothetical protein
MPLVRAAAASHHAKMLQLAAKCPVVAAEFNRVAHIQLRRRVELRMAES